MGGKPAVELLGVKLLIYWLTFYTLFQVTMLRCMYCESSQPIPSIPVPITHTLHVNGSWWCRQSQQSFNTLTPVNFLFYSLHVSAPTGHPQVRYTISYLKDYFYTTDPLLLWSIFGTSGYVVVRWRVCRRQWRLTWQHTECFPWQSAYQHEKSLTFSRWHRYQVSECTDLI
jgi:hypothetical protein